MTPEDIAFLKQAIGDRHVSAGESNLDLHSRDDLDYMRRIKSALDPQGILNPGKMLPEEK